jgi:hypothetical protein
MTTQIDTIRIPTIDIEPVICEIEWLQDELGETAMDTIYAIEDQAGDYLSCDDEDHVTVLRLERDHATVVRRVMDQIALEFDIDISAGILGVEPGWHEAEPLASTAGEVAK